MFNIGDRVRLNATWTAWSTQNNYYEGKASNGAEGVVVQRDKYQPTRTDLVAVVLDTDNQSGDLPRLFHESFLEKVYAPRRWQGTISEGYGKWMIEYTGSSITALTEVIENLKRNLADIQAGIISD